jgi:GT2 family glycosyltransferase
MVRVSVVIPTYDRPGPLRQCLTALAIGFPPDAETIVVADGGQIDLHPVVASFVTPLRLRLLHTPNRGPAAARNRGIAMARGRILAFTDDDCRPRPGWVAALASHVSDASPRAAGGLTLNGLPENVYADAAQLIVTLLSRHDRHLSGPAPLLAANNLACPAEPLRRLGGFDERFRTAEDRDLCRRWKAAGFGLTRASNAVVDHDAGLDLGRFTAKFFAYGRGAARFHDAGAAAAWRDTAGFHLRLPHLLGPELRRRGLSRGAGILALLALWETANLAGYLAERVTPARRFTPQPESLAAGRD